MHVCVKRCAPVRQTLRPCTVALCRKGGAGTVHNTMSATVSAALDPRLQNIVTVALASERAGLDLVSAWVFGSVRSDGTGARSAEELEKVFCCPTLR